MEWIIAVLKSGAAYAVADQTHPMQRTRSVIQIAQPKLVLDNSHNSFLDEYSVEFGFKLVDPSSIPSDDMPTSNLELEIHDEDLAYVVFTSGSTGKVTLSHRRLVKLTYIQDSRRVSRSNTGIYHIS